MGVIWLFGVIGGDPVLQHRLSKSGYPLALVRCCVGACRRSLDSIYSIRYLTVNTRTQNR